MTAEPTTTEQPAATDGFDGDAVAHYVKKRRLADAAVYGEAIPALCGWLVVPKRDPERLPVCPRCKAIFEDDAARTGRGSEMR